MPNKDNNNQTEIKRLQRILMQKPKDVDALLALAYIYYTEGDIENAKKHYLKTLSINSNNAKAHYNIGILFAEEKNYAEAKKHLLKALSINPNDAKSHYGLGTLFAEEKNYAEAKKHLLKALSINPNDANVNNNIGSLFAEEKNYAEAKKHLLKALNINPKLADAHYNLGCLFAEEKNYIEAKKHYLEALSINPNFAHAHNGLGILFAEEKNYIEAKKHHLQALTINPNYAGAHVNLGNLFAEEENYAEAKKHYLEALSINPNDAEAYNNLGNLFFEEKNYAEAKKHYLEALSINPNYANAHHNLGVLFYKEKNYIEAESHSLKAIEINPRFEQAHFNLAVLYKETGDIEQFTQHYLIATEIDANFKVDEWEEKIERAPVYLTIAHFGAISSKIQLELKRITVLIGQQGQGKSTVAKLICIVESLKTHLVGQETANPETLKTLFLKEIDNYGLHDYLQPNSFFRWENALSYIQYKDGLFSFSNIVYANTEFLYVPAERNFVALAAGAMQNLLLNDVPIMRGLLKFGAEFEKARAHVSEQDIPFLGIKYRYNNGTDYIESNSEGNTAAIKMRESASSHQAVVPMYVCMNYWSEKYNKSMLVVEEPELNLFPTSQKELIGFIIKSCLFAKPSNQLIITTHSPYTLTSLNNLLEADNTHRLKPRLIDKILAIVPFEKWVDGNHIAAYHLKKGEAINIFNKEYRIIADSGIDEVSDILNEEFNLLLDL
ncbi:MAG: tetratricopeptide repeat protein [Chitinophagales bacterium]|jgi:tetratricopeptide (TPR) repeat protein|nr:tetratricopeptide repeat protein [Chitinophagales bacterium]